MASPPAPYPSPKPAVALELVGFCSVQGDAGLLTNSEVLTVLKGREADKQPVVSKALPSEIEVRFLGACHV